jgi:hypothetical protein
MNPLLAYSGHGAGAYISAHIFIGAVCAVATLVLLIYTFYLYHCGHIKNYFIVKFLAFCFILHPAWTLSARSGDGGELKVLASYWIIGITFVTLTYEYIKEKIITKRSTE